MILLPVVIGVVKNSDGHILIGKRNEEAIPEIHGKWNLLGGKLEYGESPEEAIVREIFEESGVKVEVVRVLPKILTRYREKSDGTKLQIVGLCYECVVIEQPEVMNFDYGVQELRFVHPDDLKTYDVIPGELEIIELIYA